MEPQELRSRLEGVIGFPVTVFNDDLSLDLDGLRANVRAMLEAPFSAIVAAGGTGEVYSLTAEEYEAVVQATIEEAKDRGVPVIAGVGYGQAIGVRMAKKAAELGAHGILALPPYYPNAHFDGLFEYYRAIGQATPLGLLIYSRDWANFTPSQGEKLCEIPTFIAWKDGQANIRSYQMIVNRIGDRLHWIGGAGDDMVPAYYSMGIRTYTSSISNVAPRFSIQLHELGAARKEDELARVMAEYVVPLYDFRTRRKGYEVSVMKSLMDLVGLKGGRVRPPLVDVFPEELDELRAMADNWQPVL